MNYDVNQTNSPAIQGKSDLLWQVERYYRYDIAYLYYLRFDAGSICSDAQQIAQALRFRDLTRHHSRIRSVTI